MIFFRGAKWEKNVKFAKHIFVLLFICRFCLFVSISYCSVFKYFL